MERDRREETPAALAAEFLGRHRESGVYLRDNLTRLAELATGEDPRAVKAATAAIFASLVEPLADSFEPEASRLYDRLFAQLIEFCRRRPGGESLDGALSEFGLEGEEDLLARASRIKRDSALGPPRPESRVGKIIILSRVTLGADVAITSVFIERMTRALPQAEAILIGGRKASELFGGHPRLSFREVDYERSGTLISRLSSWPGVLAAIEEMTEGLAAEEYLVVDPDSRLTQLGLLPVSPSEKFTDKTAGGNYLLFPSREYGAGTTLSLGQLASDWLGRLLGEPGPAPPRVWLKRFDLEAGAGVARGMRGGGARPLVSVNFGVGGNPLKRVDGDFERLLVSGLLRSGARIILDKGAGPDEERRADAIIRHAAGGGVRTVEISEANLRDALAPDWRGADLLAWSGRVGMLAALIRESDLYVGYDSAGQHIAAALSVPCIDIFAGHGSPRMLDRWKPTGSAPARVVSAGAGGDRAMLSEALGHAQDILSGGNRGA